MNEKDRLEVMALMERRSIPEPNTGCWLWDAATDQGGYGATKWRGITRRANRLSFHAFTGVDPGPLSVMHSCDLACCVNPDHLSLGTTRQNADDRTAKGRSLGRGGKNWRMMRGASTTHNKVVVKGDEVTYEALSKVIAYDPDTGEFRWLERPDDIGWTRKNAGKVAGSISQHGKPDKPIFYVRIRVFSQDFYAHRLAWLWMRGRWPDKNEIDHENGNTLDNRIDNLRPATHAQNGHNQGLRSTNKSGVKGVSWAADRRKWFASITINGREKALGRFNTLEEAAEARRRAEVAHHGAFTHTVGNA